MKIIKLHCFFLFKNLVLRICLITGRESDGSKEDSSVDSGTETSRPEDRHEKLIIPQKVSYEQFYTLNLCTVH